VGHRDIRACLGRGAGSGMKLGSVRGEGPGREVWDGGGGLGGGIGVGIGCLGLERARLVHQDVDSVHILVELGGEVGDLGGEVGDLDVNLGGVVSVLGDVGSDIGELGVDVGAEEVQLVDQLGGQLGLAEGRRLGLLAEHSRELGHEPGHVSRGRRKSDWRGSLLLGWRCRQGWSFLCRLEAG
jgi:hypothetical protein